MRQSKPYFRKYTQSWYFSHKGKQISLGKNKVEAFRKFMEYDSGEDAFLGKNETVYALSQTYLSWVKENRSPATYSNHLLLLKGFIGHIGKAMKIARVKKCHVLDWCAYMKTTTSQNDAISTVQRMFNWAVERDILSETPIPKIKKPERKRRETVYTPDQWEKIKGHASGTLSPLLDFLWSTGCRPIEARSLKERHIHEDMVIFPPDESKGERDSRVIFLTESAKAILDPLRGASGSLFLNSRGKPWTKDALVCRLRRISKKVGFRVIAYGARHSFATNALIKSVDPVSLSHLMGHKSTRMINNYAHLTQHQGFLRQQAEVAAGERPE